MCCRERAVCVATFVQRLEAELKQSYATKNYAVKTGLLDLEKKCVVGRGRAGWGLAYSLRFSLAGFEPDQHDTEHVEAALTAQQQQLGA